jgi:hypothetical protein
LGKHPWKNPEGKIKSEFDFINKNLGLPSYDNGPSEEYNATIA